jgi:hypothetical protein
MYPPMILLFVLALAQTAATMPTATVPTDSPPLASSPTDAQINFSFEPCPGANRLGFSNGWVRYSIWGGPDNPVPDLKIQKTFSWNAKTGSGLRWTTHIPPGAYSYEVVADHLSGSVADLECSYYHYVVALPKDVRHYDETMYDGLKDPIPRVYVFGLAPDKIRVSVVHFRNKALAICGTNLSLRSFFLLQTERTGRGYYASDSYLSAENERDAVFGVRITTRDGRSRTFRTVANYPDSIVALLPTYRRFDISSTMIQKALHQPADTLVCLPNVE